MLAEGAQRARQHSFSIHPTASKQLTPNDPSTRLQYANVVIAASISLLVVGLLPLFLPTVDSSPGLEHQVPVYLRFPQSCIFFLPLLIPLSTYLVIARWTGEKHYRHS